MIIRGEWFNEELDPRAAEKTDVRPWAAFAIDQATRMTIDQGGSSMSSDVGFHATSRQETAQAILRDQHLSSCRSRRTSIRGDQDDQRCGFRTRPGLE